MDKIHVWLYDRYCEPILRRMWDSPTAAACARRWSRRRCWFLPAGAKGRGFRAPALLARRKENGA